MPAQLCPLTATPGSPQKPKPTTDPAPRCRASGQACVQEILFGVSMVQCQFYSGGNFSSKVVQKIERSQLTKNKCIFHKRNLKWLLCPGGVLGAGENGLTCSLSSVFPTLANSVSANRTFRTVSFSPLEKSYCLPNDFKNTLDLGV